jgi:hypothetical protein
MKRANQTAGGYMRRLAWILPFMFVSFVVAAAADDNKAELQSLYAAVNALNQEQQAVFQQFQMLQEMRRTNDRVLESKQLWSAQQTMEVPNYNDLVQYQKDVLRRGEDLKQQADALYAQYGEIGARKAQLQQRIFELVAPK